MTTTTTPLEIVATIDRIWSALNLKFAPAVTQMAGTDSDVDLPAEWHIYRHLMWEAGLAADLEFPGLFVTLSTRQLLMQMETGKLAPHGPDINVGICIRCHRQRIENAIRIVAYAQQALWTIAQDCGFEPHIHSCFTSGQTGSNDWVAVGTVLFGPVDGAPSGDKLW